MKKFFLGELQVSQIPGYLRISYQLINEFSEVPCHNTVIDMIGILEIFVLIFRVTTHLVLRFLPRLLLGCHLTFHPLSWLLFIHLLCINMFLNLILPIINPSNSGIINRS